MNLKGADMYRRDAEGLCPIDLITVRYTHDARNVMDINKAQYEWAKKEMIMYSWHMYWQWWPLSVIFVFLHVVHRSISPGLQYAEDGRIMSVVGERTSVSSVASKKPSRRYCNNVIVKRERRREENLGVIISVCISLYQWEDPHSQKEYQWWSSSSACESVRWF